MLRKDLPSKDTDELLYIIITNLKEGDAFTVNDKPISIKKVNKDGSMTWTVNGTNKRLYNYKGCYYGYNGKGYKADWYHQVYRDMEGILIVDLLNINNPFHELSTIAQLILKYA